MSARVQQRPTGQFVKACSTCANWYGSRLSVGKVILMAQCSDLGTATLPNDYCPSWTGLTQPHIEQAPLPKTEPVKLVRQYYSWEYREWTCEECGTKFRAQPSRKRGVAIPRRFCGNACYQAWQKKWKYYPGAFKKGLIPWNKGMKGLRFSPATEFKKGNIPQTYVPVGTVTLRDQHNGSPRKQAFIKVGEPNVWKSRALIVWEEYNGPLEKGLLLYHADNDSLNDDIGNLEAITRAENLARNRPRIDQMKRSKSMKRSWAKRRAREQALKRLSVVDLKRLGYTHYCSVCEKVCKSSRPKCHKKAEAMRL